MTIKPYITVFYHASCMDGFMSAYLLSKHFDDHIISYIPCQYGKPLPEIPEGTKEIMMVDFSAPNEVLLDLQNRYQDLTIIDHHEYAKDNFEGLDEDNVVFDTSKSGAVLTAAWLTDFGEENNKMAAYVGDRDLWTWQLLNTKEIMAYIDAHDYTFEEYAKVENEIATDIQGVINKGAAIRKYMEKIVKNAVYHFRYINYVHSDDQVYSIAIANCTNLTSELGNNMLLEKAEEKGLDFVAMYFITRDREVIISLRSLDHLTDVGKIAKNNGGGGHRNAAGFKLDADNIHYFRNSDDTCYFLLNPIVYM